MANSFIEYIKLVSGGLLTIPDEKIAAAIERIANCRGTVYFVGNGASAAMASHFAADMMKNGGVPTRCFHDPAFLTCYSNDFGYDKVFSEPLAKLGGKDDILIAVSSSGNSPNIINAVRVAQGKGIFVIGLSGFHENNQLNSLANLPIFLNAASYSEVEVCHNIILHYIVDALEFRRTSEEAKERGKFRFGQFLRFGSRQT